MNPITHPGPEAPRTHRVAALLALAAQHRRATEHGTALHEAHLRILWILSDGRPRTLRELADELQREQSTVNRQVNSALDLEIVRRYSDPSLSAQLVEPTDLGREMFGREVQRSLDAYEEALDALGAQADTFLDLLDQFVTAQGDAVSTAPRLAAHGR